MALSWTKASVDAGQHTYSEALTLMQAAGFSKYDLDLFLQYNPGDLYRVPESFDLGTGGVDPLSAGQVALAPITPGSANYVNPASLAPPPIIASAAGGPASLSLTLSGSAPAPASSYPAREYAGVVNASGGFVSSPLAQAGEGATSALGRIPWVLLLVGAGVVWYLSKGGGR